MNESEPYRCGPIPHRQELEVGLVYERIRRDTVGGRRYAPCDNSWVAVDRIVHADAHGFLFRRNHECLATDALMRDLVERDLSPVGLAVLDTGELIAGRCASLELLLAPRLLLKLAR